MQRKYRGDNYRQNNNDDFENKTHHKKYSKGMILLKSSVFAMFIVLVVLVAAYEIVKNNKQNFSSKNICNKNAEIKIAQGVESIKEKDGVIIIVTKILNGKQEIIRLDASCGVELNRLAVISNN